MSCNHIDFFIKPPNQMDFALPEFVGGKGYMLERDYDPEGEVKEAGGIVEYVKGKADKEFVYTQNVAESVWHIEHNLGKFPSVSVVDSGGSTVIGEVKYIDENNVDVIFSAEFSGKAYLN